jgi:hypothetical protein
MLLLRNFLSKSIMAAKTSAERQALYRQRHLVSTLNLMASSKKSQKH